VLTTKISLRAEIDIIGEGKAIGVCEHVECKQTTEALLRAEYVAKYATETVNNNKQ
jgi:hypothetical protein